MASRPLQKSYLITQSDQNVKDFTFNSHDAGESPINNGGSPSSRGGCVYQAPKRA